MSDPVARENLKQQVDLIDNEINALQEEQKLKKALFDSTEKKLKEAKDDEENTRQY